MGADMLLWAAPFDLDRPEVLRRFTALVDNPAPLIDAEILYEPITDDELTGLLGQIATVLDWAYTPGYHSRELCDFFIDGRCWVFTGGMSWGDQPTELCDAMQAIAELGLTFDHWDTTNKETL